MLTGSTYSMTECRQFVTSPLKIRALTRQTLRDIHAISGIVQKGILSLAVGSYRGREIGVRRESDDLGQLPMVLNPNARLG